MNSLKQYAGAIDAYRLIRRGLIVDGTPTKVEQMVGIDRDNGTTVYGDMVRRLAKDAGLPERKLYEYSNDEWSKIARHTATSLELTSERFPWYPDGWRQSYAKVAPPRKSAPKPQLEVETP